MFKMFKGKRFLTVGILVAGICVLLISLVVAQTFFMQVPGGGLLFDQRNPVIRYSGALSFQALDGTLNVKTPLTATATLNFASASDDTCSGDLTITVTGASTGDVPVLGMPAAGAPTGSVFFAWISAADSVNVRHCAINGTSDPASGTYRVDVWRH